MKKIVAILLTLILTLTLCSAALADEIWAPGKTVFIECGAPYHNFNEVVDYIRTSDKKIKIGVNMSAMSHLSWLSAFNAIDPELNNLVNYVQSGGEADKLTNIASGAIDLANCSMNNAIAYEADGKLVVLGIIGPEAATREVTSQLVGTELGEEFASLKEQGYDYSLDVGTYITLPAGTDPAIVDLHSQKRRTRYAGVFPDLRAGAHHGLLRPSAAGREIICRLRNNRRTI